MTSKKIDVGHSPAGTSVLGKTVPEVEPFSISALGPSYRDSTVLTLFKPHDIQARSSVTKQKCVTQAVTARLVVFTLETDNTSRRKNVPFQFAP